MKNFQKHIVIIPDGNRRWAKKRGFKAWIGHKAGSKRSEDIFNKALEMKIPYITFWGGSFDNLTKRTKFEIQALCKIYEEQFKKISKDKRIHNAKANINAIGKWKEIFPEKTKKEIKNAIEKTKNYKNYYLTFLLAYNGTDEMLDCIKKIKEDEKIKEITEKEIKQNLFTKNLPPVDLVIRTGCHGDPHNSAGLMMWDAAYSQLHFTETFFPDFTPEEFEEIIKECSKRERRLGA